MAFRIDEQCNGCGVCTKLCPVDAISGTKDELHLIAQEVCIECGVCGRICPQEALLDSEGNRQKHLKRSQWPKPVINDGCVGCNICIDICPFGCIDILEPKPDSDMHPKAGLTKPGKCVACRMCVNACPIEVISMS